MLRRLVKMTIARGKDRRAQAAQDPVSDLLTDNSKGVRRRPSRDTKQNQQQGHTNPVVEAAFDIQRLAYHLWKPRIGDDGTSQSGVGRSQDDAENEGIVERERAEQHLSGEPTGGNGQKKANAEEADRYRRLALECPQVHARGIGEKHNGERRFRERSNGRTCRLQINPVENQRADQDADGDDQHGRGKGRPGQISRDGRHEEERYANDRKSDPHRGQLQLGD